MRQLFLDHLARYPKMQLTDLVKLLYQSVFGCGHFVSDPQKTLLRLQQEYSVCPREDGALFEEIGGGFCRLHLGALKKEECSLETVNRLFVHSAAAKTGGKEDLIAGLDLLEEMIAVGELPFSQEEWKRHRSEYEAAGYPAVSHSESYREAYHPAYRVLTDDCRKYWTALCLIEAQMKKQPRTVLAIDGGSGTGKSHLAAFLEQIFPAAVVHMDDFFLQPFQRTAERFSEPGGNLDYERFCQQVAPYLKKDEAFSYEVFDCSCGKIGESRPLPAAPLLILEGVYSQHPLWQDQIDLRLFLTASRQTRLDRILVRNGEWMLRRFETEWIPREDLYFDTFGVEQQSVVIDTETFF